MRRFHLACSTAALSLLSKPVLAQAFGGGGGGMAPPTILNRIFNAIISDIGLGLCALFILIAVLRAAGSSISERGGGAGGVIGPVFWTVIFVCFGWFMALITGGANFGGSLFA